MIEITTYPRPDSQLVVAPLVAAQRAEYATVITSDGLLVFAGGCALTNEREIIAREGRALAELQAGYNGLVTGQRLLPYKKRTPRPPEQQQPWEGLETTEPETAREIVAHQAAMHGSLAAEVALPHHLPTYGNSLSFAWLGARTKDLRLVEQVALYDLSLPVGIKNSLSGDIEPALTTVRTINELRARAADRLEVVAAPAVLIYRGGENAQTPQAWEDRRLRAHEITEGRMLDDMAHGTEMAHDPAGQYQKSIVGQERAWEHLLELVAEGYVGVGVLTEASDAASLIDPNMPFARGVANIKRMHNIKMTGNLAVVMAA